jgi:hypothetical protein
MPYCESCGAQISLNAKFCGVCGAVRNQPTQTQQTQPQTSVKPVQPVTPKREKLNYYSPPAANAYVPPPQLPTMQAPVTQPMAQPYIPQAQSVSQPYPPQVQPTQQYMPQPQPSMPMQQPSGEAAIGYITFRKPKSMGRWDTYTGVFTTQRVIFAQMTQQMLNDAIKQSQAQAKAEGKGFFGQWGDQLRASFYYGRKYLSMPLDAIIAETPGNFALQNNGVSEVNIKLKRDKEGHVHELEAQFHSSQGNYEFHMDENSEFTDLLKRVYGDRVKMPFGYFAKSINIKF